MDLVWGAGLDHLRLLAPMGLDTIHSRTSSLSFVQFCNDQAKDYDLHTLPSY